jgi:uncharacterized membrane protein YdjX (TVP38/TMEM64 family)
MFFRSLSVWRYWRYWRYWRHTAMSLCAVAIAAAWLVAATGGLPNEAALQALQHQLMSFRSQAPWLFGVAFFAIFTLLSALALPGCSVLALAAGACFGWAGGTALVALASSLGATLSFLAARHWWREAVHRRWGHRLAPLQAGLARDGVWYLFALRMVPVVPFPVLNPLMGLSDMPARLFFSVSLLGMLAGSAAFVYAGTALGAGMSLTSVPLWGAVAGLSALALLPPLVRWHWRRRKAAP